MRAARAEAVVWSLKMASLPTTIISMRSHLLLLLLLPAAQSIMSDNCVSASGSPASSWMPMIIFSPCVRAAWPTCRRAEQSIEYSRTEVKPLRAMVAMSERMMEGERQVRVLV